MRAAGLLPLLPLLLLLLLGVRSQVDADSTTPGQTAITVATETTVTTTFAATTESPPTTPTTTTTAETTTTTTEKPNQPTVTTPPATQSITTNQSITTADPGKPPSPAAMSPATVLETTPTKPGNTEPATTTTTAHTPGQDSSSHSTGSPTATPAASSASSQPLSGATASSGSTGATNPVPTTRSSPPGAVGAATTSSPKQPQGNQSSDPSPNTAVSTTVTRTDPPQSSKDCVVSPPPCPTKQPPSSSSSPAQGPTPSISPGSTSVTRPVVSPSLTTTGSKDKVSEAAMTAAPGADQSTRDAGSASAKPTSASQSPASAQPAAPAPGQTDQTESCSPELLPHSNLPFQNELVCEDRMELTRPTIHLKEAKTCEKWKDESNDISFFERFCSTAQHKFDANRDSCTVKLMACKPPSQSWAVQVALHLPLDSEEVLKYLKENDKLEELGIINITSDKMVEDMTINDEFSTPLIITIITLAVSLLLIAAIYGCYQRFSHKKDQNIHPDVPGFDDGHVALIFNQRLTEEMQTMENGYHDNPTLEVMETSSEMQEKKVNLNGELGDSWIVPLDTLMKEDLEEEEDTHL